MWCKAEFSASLLQSSASHDPSEIMLIFRFAARETFIIISAVKRLIAINRIQNKRFCLHNIYVYFVFLLCIYKYTHMHVYISETNVMFIY